MTDVRVTLDPAFSVGPVDRRLFGSFVEHMGRCVYEGIFEPDHPLADEHGLRTDVLALVRELGVTTVRYPGGNFVSGYRWEDGVGPVDDRPVRRDLAWRTTETNRFGLDEFVRWCRAAEVEPMLAVNLGTRGVAEAVDLLEYCNVPSGTRLADQRVANGSPQPHGIRLWCLGNELDGPWQVGHKTADEYGRLAAETGRAMRRLDADVRLVACGSSGPGMPTFGTWEATVLRHCQDVVDHVSLHAYYEPHDGDVRSFLASGAGMDRFIEDVVATVDHVRAATRYDGRVDLSFDEWNVWHDQDVEASGAVPWSRAPRLIENTYDVTDAVVVGGLLLSLLNHCDRVTMASQAQLVNVIAPIRAEPGGPAWRQTIFHPFALTARYARGTGLRVAVDGPRMATGEHGDVAAVDVAATLDGTAGAVFLVNRRPDRAVEVDVRLAGLSGVTDVEHTLLAHADTTTANTQDRPDAVVPVAGAVRPGGGSGLSLTLPAASWSMVRFRHDGTGIGG